MTMVYKFTIAPCGAAGTPLRSDTLFGHACWAILMSEGQERLDGFIAAAAGQKPELVFSDGFPAGYLPRPKVPQRHEACASSAAYAQVRSQLKRQWIRRADAEQGDWTGVAQSYEVGYANRPHEEPVLRNVIDRMTGTSLEKNGLYSQNQLWYEGMWGELDIYVSTEWDVARMGGFVETLFAVGYGRDQSIGLGRVHITAMPAPAEFPRGHSGWYMSLSHVVPDATVPLAECFYQLEVKYGKVWSALGSVNPFKKRIIQTVPGSVFPAASGTERAGRVLQGIHDNTAVVENCMGIMYPLPQTVLPGGAA